MGDEKVKKVLKGFGVTEKEAEVYIFVAKHGVLRSGEIVKGIKMYKADVYRILKSLQTKGLMESTLESPTRFTAVPFEAVLDSLIKAKRDEATLIESTKQDLLSDWKNIGYPSLEPPLEKFTVIEGKHKIYAKILQMTKETKRQLSAISTVSGLTRADQFGVLDAAFNHPLKDRIQFRFLTELSEQNLNAMKTLLKRTPKTGFNFKGRNPDLGLRLFPRMVIRDDEEIIFFITPRTDTSPTGQEDVCLWTNCRALVDSFIAVFEDLWSNSTDIQKKIVEIETGQPTPTTHVISDAETASKKYDEVLRSAKQGIIMMTSSDGLVESWKNMALLREWVGRGVSVRIMAPITSENLQAAQELSKCCTVKHVPVSYLETTIVDGKHLFQFRNQPSGAEKPKTIPRFENTLYTNDLEYVEKTENMLNGVWQNARTLSPATLISLMSAATPTVAPIPENDYAFSRAGSPYRKVTTFLEEKPEIITEKDVLNKIINAKKYSAKNWPKDILRYYGSAAMAVIHSSDYFNLPDMIIMFFHCNKQSSFGAEDWFQVYLWLETPKGHAYVPVAVVGENPRGQDTRKLSFAGTPAGQNCPLVRKDDLQIRVHGNTLFAGWTVPIPLFPPQYALLPACILLEGYSRLKTSVCKWALPSGVKVTTEGNGYDAFVTFFHTSSKYAGPGTDGILSRDMIMTIYPP